VCAAIAGAVLGLLSVYIVLRRMVFVSASVTQAAGLGVALAFFAQIFLSLPVEPALGAALLALLASLLFVFDMEGLRLTRESVLGLVFAFTGGAAVMVGDRISQEAHDIQSILFGSAVLVRPLDLKLVAIVGAAVTVINAWWYRGLTFANFDPITARVQGLPVTILQAVLLVSVGAMIGVSARALGALPVFAFSTLPAVAALVPGLPMGLTFVLAAAIGLVSGVGGYMLAYFFEFPVGPTQSVLAAGIAAVAVTARWVLAKAGLVR
jgi:zinc transport system permease protein